MATAKPGKKRVTTRGHGALAALARPKRPATITNSELSRRAYDLYLSRGGEHGHDVDDWLQAERELRNAIRSSAE